MLFSISVSFTNKNVNHIVIFELKKLLKKYTNMRQATCLKDEVLKFQ